MLSMRRTHSHYKFGLSRRFFHVSLIVLYTVSAIIPALPLAQLGPTQALATADGKIAFVTTKWGNYEIGVVRGDGLGAISQFTNNPAEDFTPKWSPDGTRIAFKSNRGGDGKWRIYIIDGISGGNAVQCTDPVNDEIEDSDPNWSYDGSQIVFRRKKAGNNDIWVIPYRKSSNTCGNATRVISHDADETDPAFSPNGDRIAFSSNRDGNYDIFTARFPDGGGIKKLTDNPNDDLWPDYSPDGSKILYHSTDGNHGGIYTVKSNGAGTRTEVFRASNVDAIRPDYSPYGDSIVFQYKLDGNAFFDLYTMQDDGTNSKRIVSQGNNFNPDWLDATDEMECKITAKKKVSPNEVVPVSVKVTNIGTSEWHVLGEDPYRLAGTMDTFGNPNSRWRLQSGGNEAFNDPPRIKFNNNQVPVRNDEDVTFDFKVRVPADFATNTAPGAKMIGFNMVEGQTFFGPTDRIRNRFPGMFQPGYGCYFEFREGDPSVKIFGANVIRPSLAFVRDNLQFDTLIQAYLWPNVGRRGNGNETNRFWLDGIWGNPVDKSGEGRTTTDLNNMSTFNANAEAGCFPLPASPSCLQRIPLAYVNGGGGGATPNGNKWYEIRERIYGAWSQTLGGIASRRNDNVGGHQGNHIQNVEISSIRVGATNIQRPDNSVPLQGRGDKNTFQDDPYTQSALAEGGLPAGSQGPKRNNVPMNNTWDNIQPNPNLVIPNYTEFPAINTSSSGADDPSDMLSVFRDRARTIATAETVSRLQDGNGNGYTKTTEPLTYSGGFKGADLRLVWDEYARWTQVDDKGYWRTVQGSRPTGVDRGNPTNTTTNESYFRTFNPGSRQPYNHVHEENHVHATTHRHTYNHCHRTNRFGSCTLNHLHTFYETHYSNHTHYVNHTHYTEPSTVCGGTSVQMNYSNYTYYTPRNETRHGWLNSDSRPTGMIPYGPNGGRAISYFADPSPVWADTGTTAYWQDGSVTTMDASGATNPGQRTDRWIINYSDPMYSNRRIFNNTARATIPTGYSMVTSDCRSVYPNGSYSIGTRRVTVPTYYASPSYMYENTTSPTDPAYGLYGNGATFDGARDGSVDVGWDWRSNIQRVRYEHTFRSNYRELGRWPSGGNIIHGLDNAAGMKPARGMAIIGSPTISATDGDIYAGGGISSYFEDSDASSAFIFTPSDRIENYQFGRVFQNYFQNPDTDRSKVRHGGSGAHTRIFKTFGALESGAQALSGSHSGSFDLSRHSTRVYRRSGDLTLTNTSFCGGSGTIIVTGNLRISGSQLDYCGSSVSTRSQLPSVGFIVLGNITVDASVSRITGAFFTNGKFSSGSVLLDSFGNPTNNRSSLGDTALDIQGLVIANSFSLDRQPSGDFNAGGGKAESFRYDGRIVLNPPPGFSDLYTAPAVWNEAAPRN